MEIKYHPIIKDPHLYEISDFHYHNDLSDCRKSYIDLSLVKGLKKRILRFIEPKDLSIEKGFPFSTGGMYIEDISSHGLERINIQVDDFEPTHGSIRFLAYKVIDLELG